MKSGRGGSRPGSGRPSRYSTSDVITIKVPREMRETILAIADALDSGAVAALLPRGERESGDIQLYWDGDGEACMKLSDVLKRLKTYKLRGEDVVRLADLHGGSFLDDIGRG